MWKYYFYRYTEKFFKNVEKQKKEIKMIEIEINNLQLA